MDRRGNIKGVLNDFLLSGLIEEVYIKNSSVECESGSQVLPGRSSIDISITRNPRNVGSVICKPFGL